MTSGPGTAGEVPKSSPPSVKDKRHDWTKHQFENVRQTMCRTRKKGKRAYQIPSSLQHHIDREDRRIKELTEGILYEFLPAALNVMVPNCEDPSRELKPERCRAVAGAALAVASLMNAPPGFLEFLCCVPWSNLAELYPSFRPEAIEALMPQLHVSDDERKALVNMKIDPCLMDCVLDFLYREEHMDSVPPTIRLTNSQDAQDKPVTRDTVAALLDGATPLHCAAVRGNPAQIEHLINCGAELFSRTSAGEIPIELIPVCNGDKNKHKGSCRCMVSHDQEVWKCQSGDARRKMIKRCLLSWSAGLFAWCRMVVLVLLCLLGAWGLHPSLDRPAIDKHMRRRAEAKRQEARAKAETLLHRMRSEAKNGQSHLLTAKQKLNGNIATIDPGGAHYDSGDARFRELSSHDDMAKPSAQDAERAFECFVRAVHALQGLDLRGGTLPQGFAECGLSDVAGYHVLEDEQAELYCCWAQSVLMKFRGCTCPGCAALAVQAIRMAHIQGARLFTRTDKARNTEHKQWKEVGKSLVHIIHAHICLLLETEARQSAVRASVWQAQQCLQEWAKMSQWGLTAEAGVEDSLQVQCLEQWSKTADADLLLVEALHGSPLLPTQPLAEVLPTAVFYGPTGKAFLSRPVSKETAQQLDTVLSVAHHASDHLAYLTRSIAKNAYDEMAAAELLREVMNIKSGTTNVAGVVAQLTEAIDAASFFPHLENDVEVARQLKERWIKRAEAVAKLDEVMEQVRAAPTFVFKTGNADEQELFRQDWEMRISTLDQAVEHARLANISVNKAKRLLKDMQAQAAAVDAAAKLDDMLSKPPCGSAPLKAALTKAESASSAAASNTSGLTIGSDWLAPRIQAARKQLEVEKAAETLAKAAQTAKTVADLPKLEAAILSARKVGAEELDPEAYRCASDLRAKFDVAAKTRQALEASVKLLQRGGARQEDVETLEKALEEAGGLGDLLSSDTVKAKESLQRWKLASAAEIKLNKALRDGASSSQLSRCIQEAAAVGVKVGEAKKMLKLMQSLEAAMLAAAEGPPQPSVLKSKIEAAEQGGVPVSFLEAARAQVYKLQVAETKALLEAALKPRSGQPAAQRSAALKLALDKSEELLGDIEDSKENFQVNEEGEKAVAKPDSASEGGCSSDSSSDSEGLAETLINGDDDLVAVRRMAAEVRKHLQAEQEERERIEKERQEEQRIKRERQAKEKAEREKLEKEKAERERLEKEKNEKEKANRKEKERQVREVLTAITDRSRYSYQRALREREDRAQQENATPPAVSSAAPSSPVPAAPAAPPTASSAAPVPVAGPSRSPLVSRLNPNTPPFEPQSEQFMSANENGGVDQRILPELLMLPGSLEGFTPAQLERLQLSLEDLSQLNELQQYYKLGGMAVDQHMHSVNQGVMDNPPMAVRSSGTGNVEDLAVENNHWAVPVSDYNHGMWGNIEHTADSHAQSYSPDAHSQAYVGRHDMSAPTSDGLPSSRFPDLGGASWGMDGGLSSLNGLHLDLHSPALPNTFNRAWTPQGNAAGAGDPLPNINGSPLSSSLGALGFISKDDLSLSDLLTSRRTTLFKDDDFHAGSLLDSMAAMSFNALDPATTTRLRSGQASNEMIAKTLRVQRPCRYFMQGFCRDGERCRFAHFGAADGQLPTSTPMQNGPHATHCPSSGAAALAGNFAFGAPGSAAFSNAGGIASSYNPPATSNAAYSSQRVVGGAGVIASVPSSQNFLAPPISLPDDASIMYDSSVSLTPSPFPGVGLGIPRSSVVGELPDDLSYQSDITLSSLGTRHTDEPYFGVNDDGTAGMEAGTDHISGIYGNHVHQKGPMETSVHGGSNLSSLYQYFTAEDVLKSSVQEKK